MLQIILSALVFIGVIAEVIIHIYMGHISSFLGYLIGGIFIFLTYLLLKFSIAEYKQDKEEQDTLD